jgi:hypothetical protein
MTTYGKHYSPLRLWSSSKADCPSRSVMEIAAVYDNLTTRPKSGGAYDWAVGERGRPRMSLDPVVLSRAQFTWVVAWHFLLLRGDLGYH